MRKRESKPPPDEVPGEATERGPVPGTAPVRTEPFLHAIVGEETIRSAPPLGPQPASSTHRQKKPSGERATAGSGRLPGELTERSRFNKTQREARKGVGKKSSCVPRKAFRERDSKDPDR